MNIKLNESSVSVQANLLQQVKPRSGGRSQNRLQKKPANMRADLYKMKINNSHQAAISVQANLLQQVKSQRDGHSQNRAFIKGLPI